MKISIADIELDLCEFPIDTSLSLEKVVDYWRKLSLKGNSLEQKMASHVLEKWEETPSLHGVVEDYSLIDQHQEFLDVLTSPLISRTSSASNIAAVVRPYGKETIYATDPYKEFTNRDMEALINTKPFEKVHYRKLLHAYLMIFKEFYGIDLPLDRSMIIEAPCPETGFEQYFKIDINTSFIEIVLKSEPKGIDDEAIKDIIEHAHDLKVWMKHLPFHHFEFRGVAVFNTTDITNQEILSRLKYDLLDKEALTVKDKFKSVQHRLRSLFKIPDLKLGVTAYDSNTEKFTDHGVQGLHGLLMSCGVNECSKGREMYQQMVEHDEPFIVSNLQELAKEQTVWQSIADKNHINSLVLAPLRDDKHFIGMIELGAGNAGALSAAMLLQIKDIIPLFSIALKRNMEERENQVETIIKKQYTAIHPAVEWRFVEAAQRYIGQKERGEAPEVEHIVFKDVYPLYGATDVRNSSTERNKAIQGDLIEHLQLARNVVVQVLEHQPMPVLELLRYKIDKHIAHIENGLFSGDEMEIIAFLRNEVEVCFQRLRERVPSSVWPTFDVYYNSIEPSLGVLYNRRKAFEESLTTINEAVSEFLEEAEEEAQALFPHYFEKYKTDGVEYNIYIGKSLSPSRNFGQLYLRNIRLWQLTTTAKIAQLTASLKPKLQLPLDATHLLLVHSSMLSIQFRLDERQFDVDGAYNIRYEIVKKRIDKALIKGTDERLTQPDMIAIVYSQDKDAYEYREYIEYLQNQGLIEEGIEDVELEPLQGVQGLRALRVKVVIDTDTEPTPTESWKSGKGLNGHELLEEDRVRS